MLEDLLDSASVGGRRAMTDLQKAAEFFDGDDDRGILLEGLVGIAAGLVDAINGVTVPDESCGPRCNCGSCDDTGSEHGLQDRRVPPLSGTHYATGDRLDVPLCGADDFGMFSRGEELVTCPECRRLKGWDTEERFAPVTKSAPLDAYQDERRLACDLGLCEQHGSRTPREHLVVPNGNTDTEKRAEDTECDRSVTPDHRRGRRFKT